MPKVSVIIPVYKAAQTIRRALDSVVAQSFDDFEIIVIDDASPDDSAGLAEAWAADKPVDFRLLRLGANRGAAGARNAGVAAARGEFIAFLDSDDEWLPNKLAAQVAVMEGDSSVVLVGCNAVWLNQAGKPIRNLEEAPVVTGTGAWKALLDSCYIATPCAMVRASALKTVEPFREDLVVGEDQDLWFRLAFIGAVAFLPEVLVKIYYVQDSLMDRAYSGMATHYLPMIEGHVAARRNVLSRSERRQILGHKYADVGRSFYMLKGHRVAGAKFLLKAIWYGYRPLEHALFLIHQFPPIAHLRRALDSARGGSRL